MRPARVSVRSCGPSRCTPGRGRKVPETPAALRGRVSSPAPPEALSHYRSNPDPGWPPGGLPEPPAATAGAMFPVPPEAPPGLRSFAIGLLSKTRSGPGRAQQGGARHGLAHAGVGRAAREAQGLPPGDAHPSPRILHELPGAGARRCWKGRWGDGEEGVRVGPGASAPWEADVQAALRDGARHGCSHSSEKCPSSLGLCGLRFPAAGVLGSEARPSPDPGSRAEDAASPRPTAWEPSTHSGLCAHFRGRPGGTEATI